MPMNLSHPNSGSIQRPLKAEPIDMAASPQPIFRKRAQVLAIESDCRKTLGPESRTNRPGQCLSFEVAEAMHEDAQCRFVRETPV